MRTRAIRAWVRALILAPVLFLLAVGAAGLVVATGIVGRSSGDHPSAPEQEPAPEGTPGARPSALTLPLRIPATAGSGPVDITVRITTTPSVPAETLEASRVYLTSLLRSLVESLPPGWTPDSQGLATLRRAIEDAVPVSLAPSLPEGTQVLVEATPAEPPAPSATPAAPPAPSATPVSP